TLPESALHRFAQLGNLSEATSWQKRLMMWEEAFALWLESPVFGWGPAKETMPTYVDNEWLLMLRRYGILGAASLTALYVSMFAGLERARRAATNPASEALSIALQGTLTGWVVYMGAATVYHSLRLMPIFLIFA